MNKYSLEIDGLEVEISPKPIKNLYLRITPPHAKVTVSAPLGYSLNKIRNQINAKKEWIHFHRERILSISTASQPLFQNGESILYLGHPYPLNVIETNKRTSLRFQGGVFHLQAKQMTSLEQKNKLFDKWYRNEMQNLLPNLIAKWEQIIGVQINQWGIKRMRSRWGSCNIRYKRIWLNLELIKKPLACIESVIVHEMVHLYERYHNARFYNLMDQFFPEWRDCQTYLK